MRGRLIGSLDRTVALHLVLATSFACLTAGQHWTACRIAEVTDLAGTCCGSCCHMQGWPWRSSAHSPCCPGQAFEAATSDLAAVAAGAVAAVDRIATLHETETAETAEVEVAATFGSKDSRCRMVFDDVVDQGPFPLLASLDASAPEAWFFAWLIRATPSGFADWESLSMTEASSANFDVT